MNTDGSKRLRRLDIEQAAALRRAPIDEERVAKVYKDYLRERELVKAGKKPMFERVGR